MKHLYSVEITVWGRVEKNFYAKDEDELEELIDAFVSDEVTFWGDFDQDTEYRFTDEGETTKEEAQEEKAYGTNDDDDE